MDTFQVIVLSLVQGLTEFLPISSSAHLILVNRFLGFEDSGVVFDVAAHFGSLLAVLLFFRRDIAGLLAGEPAGEFVAVPGRRLLLWVALATVPALAIGYAASGFIETELRGTGVIVFTTLLFAPLLWWADRTRRGDAPLSLRIALVVGLAQTLALVPGTSRAGITITAGLLLGLNRAAAARFSFLLAIPVVGAAGSYGFLQMLAGDTTVRWGDFALAIGVSCIAAYACIAAFLKLLDRIGLTPFVLYRVALGLALWILLARGVVS